MLWCFESKDDEDKEAEQPRVRNKLLMTIMDKTAGRRDSGLASRCSGTSNLKRVGEFEMKFEKKRAEEKALNGLIEDIHRMLS